MPKLLLKHKEKLMREIPFANNSMIIGREKECDIMISDMGISREHARVFSDGENFFVEDLNSANGTLVNGQPLSSKYLLQDKDVIQLENHSLQLLVYEEVRSQTSLSHSGSHISSPITGSRITRKITPEDTMHISAEKQSTTRVYRRLTATGIKKEVKRVAASIELLQNSQRTIILNRPLMVAGRGASAIIPIEGNYQNDVVFTVTNRSGEFYISPAKEISVKVDGKIIAAGTKLESGNIIEAADTKMRFVLRPKPLT